MGFMNLYAQHLGSGASEHVDETACVDAIERAADHLRRADAVVVGIGSGMSSACGYDHYHRIPAFDDRFARFERAFGFSTLMDGYYHLYASNEERWAFLAEYIAFMEESLVGAPYRQLAQMLQNKPHFVLTTNIDGQVRRAFPEDKAWLFQGDFGYLQCSQPCCDRIVPSGASVGRIVSQLGGTRVATSPDLLPRCSECGWLMMPWVRDETFLEGSAWRAAKSRYERFVSVALEECAHVVFLELGVGGMTPSIIELPFWDMTRRNSNAFYLRVNVGKSSEPRQLEGKSLTVQGDIARVFDRLVELLNS